MNLAGQIEVREISDNPLPCLFFGVALARRSHEISHNRAVVEEWVVLSHHADFTRANGKIHIDYRSNARKRLTQATDFENKIGPRILPPHSVRQSPTPVYVAATRSFDLATRLRRSLREGHA